MQRVRLIVLSVFGMLIAAALLTAQAPAPGGFTVQTATATSAVLNWQAVSGASSYVVQRRAVSDAAYAFGGTTVTGTTFTDSGFDAFTAYAYRVFAVAGTTAGLASVELFVGPPPVGFSYAVLTPSRVATTPGASISEYGQSVSIALDGNGDPALAFKDNSTSHATNQPTDVYFLSWNRAAYQWNAPVKVDTVHSSITPYPELSLAYDASTKRFGIAYESYNDNILWFASSTDGGATWSKQQAFAPATGDTLGAGTALKMGAGQVYLLVSETNKGIWYLNGSQTSAPTTWTKQISPTSGSVVGFKANYDVALDSAGNPGVVYSYQVSSGEWIVQFWRPPATVSVVVTNSNSVAGNDTTDAKLAFSGTNPRVVVQMARDSLAPQNKDLLWLIASSDGGTTWGTPTALPNDGDRTLMAPITLAGNGQGEVSVSAHDNGGTFNGVKCGWPKLIRSKDLVNWTACNPGNSPAPDFDDQYPTAVYASNGKLYLAFQNFGGEFLNPLVADLPFTGVMLWREAPQASGLQPPAVPNNGIIGNAGEVPGKAVSPGQIIEIYGTNLASGPASAGTLPLPNLMGATTAVTTTVFINRLPAPSFYVSPGQLDVQVPFETPYNLKNPFTLEVMVNDTLSIAAPINVLPTSPGTYAVTNSATGALISNANPAHPGNLVTVYMTGLGAVTNQPASGAPAPTNPPLAMVSGTVTATIGGQSAPVSFSGLTPGSVGLYQVNLQIPTLSSGSYPLILSVFHAASNTTNSSQSVNISVVSP